MTITMAGLMGLTGKKSETKIEDETGPDGTDEKLPVNPL